MVKNEASASTTPVDTSVTASADDALLVSNGGSGGGSGGGIGGGIGGGLGGGIGGGTGGGAGELEGHSSPTAVTSQASANHNAATSSAPNSNNSNAILTSNGPNNSEGNNSATTTAVEVPQVSASSASSVAVASTGILGAVSSASGAGSNPVVTMVNANGSLPPTSAMDHFLAEASHDCTPTTRLAIYHFTTLDPSIHPSTHPFPIIPHHSIQLFSLDSYTSSYDHNSNASTRVNQRRAS